MASLAVSLYDYVQENNIQNITKEKLSQKKMFLLFGADISGIQSYIYDVKSKYAAKNLKGRSFMLHLITTTIVRKILDDLDLFFANVIYNSGGGFYMLLPNTEKIKNKLAEIEKEIEKELIKQFRGSFFLAVDYVPLSGNLLMNKEGQTQTLTDKWTQLFNKLSAKKKRKFINSISENYGEFFEPQGQSGGDVFLDDFTGEEIENKEEVIKKEGLQMSPITEAQIELGKKLKSTQYWYISKQEKNNALGNSASFKFLGYNNVLASEKDNFYENSENTLRITLNNFNCFECNHKITMSFDIYGGNNYPTDADGSPKTYDKLPKGEYNKIGILRMDVDNLGYLFQSGFSKEKRTLSRLATLSRNLDLFFRGYINTLWESSEDYQNHVVILYSGGDDVFALGDWDIVRKFGAELRNKFKEFVCNNEIISLSGGELIVPPKYPILKSAIQAQEMEDLAKKYEWNTTVRMRIRNNQGDRNNDSDEFRELNKMKDAFAFINSNTAFSWEHEYTAIIKMAEELKQKIDSKKLPSGLLHRIMEFALKPENDWRKYWLFAYHLGRMKQRYKDEKDFLDTIQKDLLNNTWNGETRTEFNVPIKELYATAARLAELWIRDEK